MNITIFRIRYYLAANLINLGIKIMPSCHYKTMLMQRLLELKLEIEAAVYAKITKENVDGGE